MIRSRIDRSELGRVDVHEPDDIAGNRLRLWKLLTALEGHGTWLAGYLGSLWGTALRILDASVGEAAVDLPRYSALVCVRNHMVFRYQSESGMQKEALFATTTPLRSPSSSHAPSNPIKMKARAAPARAAKEQPQ